MTNTAGDEWQMEDGLWHLIWSWFGPKRPSSAAVESDKAGHLNQSYLYPYPFLEIQDLKLKLKP